MRINGEAPAVMAEEARKLGAGIIHYSTDYVFDGSKQTAYLETDPTCPINVYGATKLAGEQAIQACRRAAPDPAHQLGVWHARQEFPADDDAPGGRAR